MTTSANSTNRPFSGVFTAVSILLFLGGFYLAGSMFFAAQPWYFRLLIVFGGLGLSVGALMLTDHWTHLSGLFKGARIELRKVHWPGKNELVRMTLIVLAIVAVFSLFLTIVDALLALLIRWVL